MTPGCVRGHELGIFEFTGHFEASNLLSGAGKAKIRMVEASTGSFLAVENSISGEHKLFGLTEDQGATVLGPATGFNIVGTGTPTASSDQNATPDHSYICFDPQTQGLGSFTVLPDGTFSSVTQYTTTQGQPTDVVSATVCNMGDKTLLIVAQAEGPGLACYEIASDNSLTFLGHDYLSGTNYSEGITQLSVIAYDGQDYVASLSMGGNGLTILKPEADGSLTVMSELGEFQGLGLNAPTNFETVTLDDQTYILLSATNTSSISVARLLNNGSIVETDHVIDSQQTRFEKLADIETVTVNGRVLVFSAGSDGGVTGMELLPSGRLTHIFSTDDTNQGNLGNVVSLTAQVVGGEVQLFALSEDSAQIAQYTFDLNAFGDKYNGSVANDDLVGGRLNDLLSGGLGDDTLRGGDGNDTILDGDGHDVMYGGSGSDVFVIDIDDDTDTIMDFNVTEDLLDLSAAPQIYSVDSIEFVPTANGAFMMIGDQALQLFSHDGNSINVSDLPFSSYTKLTHLPSENAWSGEILTGQATDDLLIGSAARELFYGQEGNDHLIGGAGNDRQFGGAGHDRLEGGFGNDELTGDSGNDTLFGGQTGDDRLSGGDGDDKAFGENGNDYLDLGAGDDTARGGDGQDQILSGSGNDISFGENGEDTIWGGDGQDLLFGGLGNDALYGDADADLLQGNEGNDSLDGGTGHDRLEGGGGSDDLRGGFGNDLLIAGTDSDLLIGGEGSDTLHGESGDDHLIGGNQDDRLDGGDGNDLLEGGFGNDAMFGDAGDDRMFGGPDGQDELNGGAGVDRMYGQNDNDTLRGGNDDDFLFGGSGDDRLEGGGSNDVMKGEDGNDVMLGGTGSDFMLGGSGNDVLHGESGNDRIEAGAGINTVSGGNGVDTFVFGPSDMENTRILDFLSDMIDLTSVTSINDWDDLTENHLSEVGPDLHIAFDNSLIILQGTSINEVSKEMFLF